MLKFIKMLSVERSEKQIFKNCLCGKPFYNRTSYFVHKKCCEQCKTKTVYKSCDCGKNFFSKTSYFDHKKNCEQCKKKSVYKTCDCGKNFYSETMYYFHTKTCAKEQWQENVLFKICACNIPFYNKSLYYGHIKNCSERKNEISANFRCQEENCKFTCSKRLKFLKHLKHIHSIDSCTEGKTFQTYEEFEDWKEQLEKTTRAFFKVVKVNKFQSGSYKYFICNHSGTYISKSAGKRALKSQGVCRIGFNCTASMSVQIKEKSPVVKVILCNLHYGHENKLAFIRTPKSVRSSFANQLSNVESSRICRNPFSTFPTKLQSQHLVMKHDDFRNVAAAYGINKIEKHSEDHLSVDAHVEESLQEEKCIFLYKRQGESFLHFPKEEQCTLDKEDFVSGIATEFQRQMLKKFGNNIIYLDTTHGTNSCDFKLITVLVIDEFKEGIPVAWLICNKDTQIALKLFFHLLKNLVGNISPKFIISNKAPQYYKSWIDVFEGMPRKLLCHCHVHDDWQKNINKIKNKDAAVSLYKELCILIEETNKEKFENLLHELVNAMYDNEHTHEFGKYFVKEWLNIKEQWANCHRFGAEIITNWYLESFHELFKYGGSYLKGKHIDKCLYKLIELSKDLKTNVNVPDADCINQIENDAGKNYSEDEDAVSNISIDINIDNPNNEYANWETECQNVDEDYIFSATASESLEEIKSDLRAKMAAIVDFIEKCDNIDLLLIVKEHIERAISVLKSGFVR